MYAAMKGTRWAAMAFDNEFAYNDFSKVRRESLKGAICIAKIRYNLDDWYLWQSPKGIYILNRSRGQPVDEYDLAIDGDRIRFWFDHVRDIQAAVADDMASFTSYSIYSLIMGYNKTMLD